MKTIYFFRFILATAMVLFVGCGPQNKLHTLKPSSILFADEASQKTSNIKAVTSFIEQKRADDNNVTSVPVSKSVVSAQSLAARISAVLVDDKDSTLSIVLSDNDKKQYQVIFSDPKPAQLNHAIVFSKVTISEVTNAIVKPAQITEKFSAEIKLSKSGLMIVSISSVDLDSSGNRPTADFLIRTNRLTALSDNKTELAKEISQMNLFSRITQAYFGDDSNIDQGKLPQALSSPANQLKIQGLSNGNLLTLVSSIQSQSTLDGNSILAKVADNQRSESLLANTLNASQITIQLNTTPLISSTLDMTISNASGSTNVKFAIGDVAILKIFSEMQSKANDGISLEVPKNPSQNSEDSKTEATVGAQIPAAAVPKPQVQEDQKNIESEKTDNDAISKNDFENKINNDAISSNSFENDVDPLTKIESDISSLTSPTGDSSNAGSAQFPSPTTK